MKGNKIVKVLAIVLVIAMSLSGCAKSGSKYVAGTYTGEAEGFGGTVKVTITVSDSKIEKVDVTGDKETEQSVVLHLEHWLKRLWKSSQLKSML